MTTIATSATDSWGISIGGGWIVLMLIGMALCFVFMLGFMGLMREGRGWAMCGRRRQQQTPHGDMRGSDVLDSPGTRKPTRSHLVSERSQ